MSPLNSKLKKISRRNLLRNTTLAYPPAIPSPDPITGPPARVGGIWDVTITYLKGTGHQRFLIEQEGEAVAGVHQGSIYEGTLKGEIASNQILLHSALPVGGNEIHYTFKGTIDGDTMSEDVALGEYGKAKWATSRVRT